MEGITEYHLDNGLQVLLFPDNSKPTVTVNVTYMVGSRHEGAGETGMAHLLEHMLFKGTQKHKEIMGELSAHGNDFNGSTSWDRTNYFETVPATDADLRWALEMESDRMVNSRVAKSDLDSEMTVVRNEFERGENSPDGVLEERVLSTAYLWHAYGRSPIGTLSDIEKVPIEKLQAFYRNYYQPDDAMLLVAGKFDPAKTLGWITEYFRSHSQAHPQAAAHLHRRTHPGRRTRGGSAARGRSPVGHDGVPRPRRVASGFAGIGCSLGHLVGCARGASLQSPGREQEGRQRRRLELFAPRSGRRDVQRNSGQGQIPGRRGKNHAERDRRPDQGTAQQGRSGPRQAPGC